MQIKNLVEAEVAKCGWLKRISGIHMSKFGWTTWLFGARLIKRL